MTDIASRPWDAICEMQAADGAMTKAGFVRRYEEIVAAAKKEDQPAMTTDAMRAAMYDVTGITGIMRGGAPSGTEILKQRYSQSEAERFIAQQYERERQHRDQQEMARRHEHMKRWISERFT